MLIGNAIGAFALGYLCWFIFKDTSVIDTVNAACASRTTLETFNDYLTCIVKSILCGTCVYLAVKCFNMNRLKPLGISLLVFFVFLFVYCGFQHCIANMFYFGFGNWINPKMFINLALVIAANSIGPIIGIGVSKVLNKNKV